MMFLASRVLCDTRVWVHAGPGHAGVVHWPADMQGGTGEDVLSGAMQHAHVLDGGGGEDDQGWSEV